MGSRILGGLHGADIIAQWLQQLYNDVIFHFDQVYASSIVAQLGNSRASGQLPPQPPQPQPQPHQPEILGGRYSEAP